MTKFDAQRIEYILRRHGWSAYAYYDDYRDTGLWRVVASWPGEQEEKWERGVEGAWYTVSNMGQALHAISTYSAQERRGTA